MDGVSQYAHRLAWLYVHGVWPPHEVDHINGDRSDNRIANLRLATRQQNSENRHGAQSNSKTGLVGVSWHKRAGKWQAHIRVKGRTRYLGLFESTQDACMAYLQAKQTMGVI